MPFSANMTLNWVKYIKHHRKSELALAIGYTIFVFVTSVYHINDLIVSYTVL